MPLPGAASAPIIAAWERHTHVSTDGSGPSSKSSTSSSPRPPRWAVTARSTSPPRGSAAPSSVLDERTVAYLDFAGSNAETVAHLRENGRITLMWCAFQGPPNIVRVHGRGEPVFRDDPRFPGLLGRFPRRPGPARAARDHRGDGRADPGHLRVRGAVHVLRGGPRRCTPSASRARTTTSLSEYFEQEGAHRGEHRRAAGTAAPAARDAHRRTEPLGRTEYVRRSARRRRVYRPVHAHISGDRVGSARPRGFVGGPPRRFAPAAGAAGRHGRRLAADHGRGARHGIHHGHASAGGTCSRGSGYGPGPRRPGSGRRG